MYFSNGKDDYVSVRLSFAGEKKLEVEMPVIKGFFTIEAKDPVVRMEKYRLLLSKKQTTVSSNDKKRNELLRCHTSNLIGTTDILSSKTLVYNDEFTIKMMRKND